MCLFSLLFGQDKDSSAAEKRKHLYLYNGNFFDGDFSHLKVDSIYLVFVEKDRNPIFDNYFPDVEGIIFAYSRRDEVKSISLEQFEAITKLESPTYLYKVDIGSISTNKSGLKKETLDSAKSINMISLEFRNDVTCEIDSLTLFLINTGAIFERGVSRTPPKIDISGIK